MNGADKHGTWTLLAPLALAGILACGNDSIPAPITAASTPTHYALVWPSRPSSAPANSRIVGPGVRMLDGNELPVKNITVRWSVQSGGGTLIGTSEVTDADGISTSGMWQLGPVVGTQSLTIAATGINAVTISIPMTTTAP